MPQFLNFVQEQSLIARMLVENGITKSIHEANQLAATSQATRKQRRMDARTRQALDVADEFLELAAFGEMGTHPAADAPDTSTIKAVTEEIRYRLGIGTIAWFFARFFITRLVTWLWNEYFKMLPEVPDHPDTCVCPSCVQSVG